MPRIPTEEQHERLDAIGYEEDALLVAFPDTTCSSVVGWEDAEPGPVVSLPNGWRVTVTVDGGLRPTRGRLAYWPEEASAWLRTSERLQAHARRRAEHFAEAA